MLDGKNETASTKNFDDYSAHFFYVGSGGGVCVIIWPWAPSINHDFPHDFARFIFLNVNFSDRIKITSTSNPII
jgi:hypothetical protein